MKDHRGNFEGSDAQTRANVEKELREVLMKHLFTRLFSHLFRNII